MSATLRHPVVLDATVLSNFASTGTVDVLVDTLDRPATVPAVQTELERGYAQDYDFLDDALARIGDDITLLGVEERPATGETAIREHLDSGEAEALLGAIKREGTLATDDLAAREMATERGVPVTGSVGLLVVGIHCGEIDAGTANQWLDEWRATRGYYAPVERIEEVLE
jgi:Predicted nucleic acid-binding protein, contains PIN domain